jgi:hypothetical protein
MRRIILAAGLVAACTMPAFAASDIDPASKKIMHDYTLSLAKVKAYDAAASSLKAAEKIDPGLRADADAAAAEQTNTMNEEFAKLTHHPRVFAFFAKQGLSKEDVILVPLTLMSACMVVQYPSAAKSLSDQTSPAQVAFCKQNIGTLKTLKFFSGG